MSNNPPNLLVSPITREQALEIAERATEILKTRFGATRVIVFGSARGDAPWHEGSDLDLAVEGLPKENFWDAYGAVENLMPYGLDFDLVKIEKGPPELIARILGEVEMPADPLLALKGLVNDELASIQRIVSRMDQASRRIHEPPDWFEMNSIGKLAYDFYRGAESIFERITVQIDHPRPEGKDWHSELLKQMLDPFKDIRPAVIDSALHSRLDEYRRFRHFFRSAYDVELEWTELEPKMDQMRETFEMLRAQLDTFFTALAQMKNNEQ